MIHLTINQTEVLIMTNNEIIEATATIVKNHLKSDIARALVIERDNHSQTLEKLRAMMEQSTPAADSSELIAENALLKGRIEKAIICFNTQKARLDKAASYYKMQQDKIAELVEQLNKITNVINPK